MKIRTGFVSNSSSSSFICDICGHVESGYDVCLSEIGMFECEEGHTLCEEHKLEGVQVMARLKSKLKQEGLDEDDIEDRLNDYYSIPVELCPLCMLTDISKHDQLNYLKHKHGETKEGILAEVKERYATYGDLQDSLYKRSG